MKDLKVATHVYYQEYGRGGRKNKKPYRGKFTYKNTAYCCGNFETIREAQISVDRKRLDLGLKPLILKAKT